MLMAESYGVVALFLRSKTTRKLFGVTNYHVLLHASSITLNTAQERGHILLGQPMQISQDLANLKDIAAVFEVKDNLPFEVSNEVRDIDSNTRRVVPFSGNIQDLYGRRVMKLRPYYSSFKVNHDDTTSLSGLVNTRRIHTKFGSSFFFFVKGENGLFSQKGDSGTPVVIYVPGCNDLQMVGFIVGNTKGVSEYDTSCVFLPEVIKHLEETHKISFSMTTPVTSTKPVVPIGSRIYLNSSSVINLESDLLELAIAIMSRPFKSCNINTMDDLFRKEKDWKRAIYNGLAFSLHSECDNPTQRTLTFGCLALSSIFKGQRVDSELSLRYAFECLQKCKEMTSCIFSRILGHLTQFYAIFDTAETREHLQTLFQKAVVFSNKNSEVEGFPSEAVVKICLNLSQTYQRRYSNISKKNKRRIKTKPTVLLRTNAITWARRAVVEAQKIYYKKKTRFSTSRLAVAKCELAYSLLGCGHYYKNIREGEIPRADIEEAEVILRQVREYIEDIFVVPSLLVNIVECDLAFRLKRYPEALAIARKSHARALENSIFFVARRTNNRYSYIHSKMSHHAKQNNENLLFQPLTATSLPKEPSK